MSLIKPDINYNPNDKKFFFEIENQTIAPERKAIVDTVDREALYSTFRLFLNNYSDADILRFFNISKMTYLTNTNIRNSSTFLEKFIPLYIGSLQKTFPKKDWSNIEKSLFDIKNEVANLIKHDNMENIYLLPMILGITEALLNYENY